MPRSFTSEGGWKALHAQRARADAALTEAKEARAALEAAQATAAAAQAQVKDAGMEAYLRGRGATLSPRARRALARTFDEDVAGAEKPVAFHEWIEQPDVAADPYVISMLGGQALKAAAAKEPAAAKAPAAPAPNPAGGRLPGGQPRELDLAKLSPAEVARMIEAKEITEAEVWRQTAVMK